MAQGTPCAVCMRLFSGHGHLGWPLTNGRVCDVCHRVVLVARVGELLMRGEDE